jgi:peptidoglycan/LPS O-acetylase OafA/YrhL
MSTDGFPRRIPSLDGLRAVSIGLVLVQHISGTAGFPIRNLGSLMVLGDIGYLGVRTFFIISGFLITTLLLKEHEKTGTISLGDFYIRRAFRIFPAMYVFVLVMLVAGAMGAIRLQDGDALHALTYTMNYHYLRSWELGHLWSLSVEEQFYLLWPALLLLAGPRWIGHVAAGMILLAPVMRVLAWYFAPSRDDVIMEAYPCVMDAIAAGSLLAVTRRWFDGVAWYQRFLRSPLFLAVPVAVALLNPARWVAFDYTLGITLQVVGITLMVDRVTRVSGDPVYWLLNSRAMVWAGTLSYSLYLWQEPFLNPKGKSDLNAFPVNLLLALACAVASYFLVEKPFFSLREAWNRRRSRQLPARASVDSA